LELTKVQNLARSSVDMMDPVKDPPEVFVSDMHCGVAVWDEFAAVCWVEKSAVLWVVCSVVQTAVEWVDESAVRSAVGWVDESAVLLAALLDG